MICRIVEVDVLDAGEKTAESSAGKVTGRVLGKNCRAAGKTLVIRVKNKRMMSVNMVLILLGDFSEVRSQDGSPSYFSFARTFLEARERASMLHIQ